jgi:hypothetical protein
MVLIDGDHEDGLFVGVNGKPVAISSLSDAELPATPPAEPPAASVDRFLKANHAALVTDNKRQVAQRMWSGIDDVARASRTGA